MAAVFSRLPMRVRCATQRDHVFHPEMNYSQAQLDQLDRLTERWVADHLQKGKTSKKDKELVTLECKVRPPCDCGRLVASFHRYQCGRTAKPPKRNSNGDIVGSQGKRCTRSDE